MANPIWTELLLLAVLLLPLDITIRRLVFSRYDMQRGLDRIITAVRLGSQPEVDPQQTERLARLQAAKRRAGAAEPESEGPILIDEKIEVEEQATDKPRSQPEAQA